MNIHEQLNQGQREYGVNSGGNYYKFADGDNRMRILTSGEVLATHFFGKGQKAATCYGEDKGCPYHGKNAPKNDKGEEKKPSIKFTCYVLNKRAEPVIQFADLPYSVIKAVGDLQANVDYEFSEFPMPYDVTVKYNKDSNSPNDMYKVIPSPKREAISQDVQDELVNLVTKLSPQDSVKKKKEWQMQEHDKSGLRLKVGATKEELAQARRVSSEFLAKKSEDGEHQIEYPVNDIDPNDIPFG